jgi:GT2 family glycosyltransferase
LAIKKSQGEYIFLLNPDTELIDDSILELIKFLDQEKQAGIAGPKLLNSDLSLQRSCRKFPSLPDQIFIQLKFYNFFTNKIKPIRDYFMLDFNHDEIKKVDQVMGAAMLVRKKVFDKIGLLDERFWSVFEEVDFCKRAQDSGFKTYFFPNTKIVHHKEQSFSKLNKLKKQNNFNHSLYYYFRKHKPAWQFFVLWLLQPINLLLTFVDAKLNIRGRVGKSKDL